jgi:sec-independent protein translocase protein TatA
MEVGSPEMNNMLAFLPTGSEWIWIALIVLLLFGGSRLPQLMRSIGRGAGELQKGIEEGKRMMTQARDDAMNTPDEPASTPAKTEPTPPQA